MKKLFPLFLIFLIVISLLSCKKEKQKTEPIDKTLPQQQLTDVFMVETEKEDTIRTIKATFMKNYPDKKLTIADSVVLTEYNKDKTVKSILYCDNAEIDETKDLYKCKGNVKVVTDNGILKTPFLIWDKKNDRITAKNGVTLIRDDNVLKGETLITDSQLKKIKITKVSAKGKLKEKDIRW